MQNYQDFLAEILVDEKSLQARLKELGAEISLDYADSNGGLLLICILRGGVPFLVDLMRHITIPHMLDFMAISSYGKGARESTGNVRLTMDLVPEVKVIVYREGEAREAGEAESTEAEAPVEAPAEAAETSAS